MSCAIVEAQFVLFNIHIYYIIPHRFLMSFGYNRVCMEIAEKVEDIIEKEDMVIDEVVRKMETKAKFSSFGNTRVKRKLRRMTRVE